MAEFVQTKKIAKNTLMLYFRQILVMLVSLYTVRVVLNVLGAEDYGIYNVVAGVVTMFNFLSNSMAISSQRYFSFDLGKEDYKHLKITFNITYQIYLFIIILVVIFAESIGLWFINNKLVIPFDRKPVANLIYQFAIITFCLSLITAPYMSAIIAHEKMSVYAYVSLIEAGLKLLIAFLLSYMDYDKLILYGFLLMCASLINTSIYRIYCHKKFEECRFKLYKDFSLAKELFSYSGWNLFGAFAGVCKGQITNIVLNMFFGPVVNSARAIATQVNNAVTSFAQNFSTAMRPQVIKSYASNNRDDCFSLIYRGSKFTFFLMMIFACPLFFEMDFVLEKWLKNTPEYATIFTRLVLIETLIDTLSYQLMTLSQATGKIKLYQGVVGGLLLFNLPVSYLILKLGFSAISVCYVSISIAMIAIFARLLIIKKLTGLEILQFIRKVLCPCMIVLSCVSVVGILIVLKIKSSLFRFCLTFVILFFLSLVLIFFVGLNSNERKYVLSIIKSKVGND